jgi:molybdopterin/thiamine biosynthesis adenylyltransferase
VSCPSSCLDCHHPVPLILYFTDQVQAGAVLGPFVGALGSVQGTRLILGVFVGFNDGGL